MILSETAPSVPEINSAMQRYLDKRILAGVATAVLRGQDLVHFDCRGWADLENQIPLQHDHLFRVFSNSKLITSIAVLQLWEDGKLELDQPVESFLPQLANRRVLRPGASDIGDTEAARSAISIRQLLCHSSGLSYGFLDRGTVMYKAYSERKLLNPHQTLAEMIDLLIDLPLSFHPGSGFEYSIATDVLARVVEVASGLRFDEFIKRRILDPLAMHDTFFTVPPHKRSRLCAYYAGMDPANVLQRGLKRLDKSPYPDAYLKPVARLSGGGGLVSGMADMLRLLRSLMPQGYPLLRPATVALMMQNQLPAGVGINFPGIGAVPGKGYGLGGAVTLRPAETDPANSLGEFEWGGIAGTHWWISPQQNIAGVLMTQRQMSFWHPFAFDFKRRAYHAFTANA